MTTPLRHFRFTPLHRDLLIAGTCVISQGIYLAASGAAKGQTGFPLDDAWIYQTYARNLAQTGQWAFVPGVPSTGSTSILWTLLLAPGHALSMDAFWWTQLLGLVMLILTALGSARLFVTPNLRQPLAIGLAVALEWHLVWAAASGMETLLFTGLIVWFWLWLRRHDPAAMNHSWRQGLVFGVWGGLLMLARPEGVVALGIAGLYGVISPGQWGRKLIWGMAAGIGFSIFLIPFFGLNYAIAGQIWPNTFYAKQMEYQALWQIPYWRRLLDQLFLPVVGAQILLLPGFVSEVLGIFREHKYSDSVPIIWTLVHLGLYAARLPVVYQHGRYAIPVISILVIFGIRGMLQLARPRSQRISIRLASLTWLTSTLVLFPVALIILGAPAYRRDVAFIQDEMVSAAQWVAENTDTHSMIAAHDIGALGYIAPRQILDLAGLISPDVIPSMTDANQLTVFILQSDAEYLVAFPRWSDSYAIMLASPHFCAVWVASERESYIARSDLGPMTVYRISREGGCPVTRQASVVRNRGD